MDALELADHVRCKKASGYQWPEIEKELMIMTRRMKRNHEKSNCYDIRTKTVFNEHGIEIAYLWFVVK